MLLFVQESVALRPPRDPNIVCFSIQETAQVVALGILSLPVSYVLLRFAKVYLDDWQANKELNLTKRQTELIEDLSTRGYTQQEATEVVQALLKAIDERSANDPVLEQLFSFARPFLQATRQAQVPQHEETRPQLPPSI